MSGEKVNTREKGIFSDDMCDLGLIGATYACSGLNLSKGSNAKID